MKLADRVRAAREPRNVSSVARRVRAQHLPYLSWSKLANLERCLLDIDHAGVCGDILEMGVALGGSAVVLANGMAPDRSFHGYDVFGMIPPPTDRDDRRTHERYETIVGGDARGLGGHKYYGYVDDLYGQVAETLASFGHLVDGVRVSLHRGPFEDTLHPSEPVALAHIDSDWYEPVRLRLERLHPQLSVGGLVVLDDFFDYAGCATATHEYLAQHEDLRMIRTTSSAVVQRQAIV